MILVDTSVWIDHLHDAEPRLVELLETDAICCHALVIEELALGRLKQRAEMLEHLESLQMLPVLSHSEMLALVDKRSLWGRGLSSADVHLLGAVVLSAGTQLWTRDRRLVQACRGVGVPVVDPNGSADARVAAR